MQAKLFSEEIRMVLRRYEHKQLTSAEVVERLVEIARQLRGARRRHEQLGLSEEEAAFYDALAGGIEDVKADPMLAEVEIGDSFPLFCSALLVNGHMVAFIGHMKGL
jgi:type I restriction enzyme, R subunit